MRNKITLLLVVTLVYECHSGLIKDILTRHHLLPGGVESNGNQRQSVDQGEPGPVILVVKEAKPRYGKPGYGGQGGYGHHNHENGYQHQHHYDQGQAERPGNYDHNQQPAYGGNGQYPQNKPSYGGHEQYPQNKPGYGGHNHEVPPHHGNKWPNHGGHRPGYGGHQPGYGGHQPGYGGHQPGYGGHRPNHGLHSLESNSASSEESSEEVFVTELKPPYQQGGGNFNHNQQNGNVRPGFNNGPVQTGLNNGPVQPSFNNGPVQPGLNNGPVQSGFGTGQIGGNNGPPFNQVKPVYETQQPGNDQFQQNPNNEPHIGGNKPIQGVNTPNPALNTIPTVPIKPQDPEGDPFFVPLDPTAEFNQNAGSSNDPKRETNEPKPVEADDEEYGIDVRYGDK